MRRNILNNKWFVVIAMLLAFGCRAKKAVVRTPAAKDPAAESSKAVILKNISNRQLDFNTLQLKAKANLSINDKGNDASMNIRIKKDETIWVSVTVIAGLEVARALITPDSVKVMNRLESTYINKPFDFINEFTNKQINFKTLQALLVGNTIPEFISNQSDVEFQNNQLILKGILKGLTYQVNYDANTKVVQTNLNDNLTDQKLTASYSDFFVVSDRQIPHSVSIKSFADRKKVDVRLKFTQVGVNESLEFPFSVPKRYTIIN